MAISTYLSLIILNVNELNAPIKRRGVADLIKKTDPSRCCLKETHFRAKETHRLNMRGWKKIFHADGNDKKAGVAILILDKVDFKTKSTTNGKGRYYILIKRSIQEEDIKFLKIYALEP